MNRKLFFIFPVLLAWIPLFTMANGNQSLSTNFNMTKCGLNYTTASAVTGQRPPVGGQVQPVALNISGIPAGATIEAAFLYTEGSGDGSAQTATIAGPLGTAAYPMTLIGSSSDKCWGYSGSHSYRADVTASVNGNGIYNVSGLLVDPTLAHTNDMDGCSLIVIYSQTGQLWTGTLIINDGAVEGGIANPQNTTQTITYPAICGPTSNGTAFMGIGDLQPNIAQTATLTFNGTPWPLSSDWWDLASVNTTYTAGQTFTDFNVNSTSSGDCWNICFIGVYWQNTSCAICTPPIVDLDSTSTPASCDKCNGTATIIATGSQIGYTYLWSTGDTTPTVTGLCEGTY
ncbi:MAG: hypothetical protein JSS82_15435, partial [Bacteroidetes bacterium]|nr:hypothetical protein [Bacteroidota bacterium]